MEWERTIPLSSGHSGRGEEITFVRELYQGKRNEICPRVGNESVCSKGQYAIQGEAVIIFEIDGRADLAGGKPGRLEENGDGNEAPDHRCSAS